MATLPIPMPSGPLLRGRRAGSSHGTSPHATGIAVALALAVHAGLLAALWSYAPARKALRENVPIVVELPTPPRVEPRPPPPPATARPHPAAKPQMAPHVTPPPPAAAPAQAAPEPLTVAPPAGSQGASTRVEPAPVIAAPVIATPVIAAPLAPAAPPARADAVPPRFDADYLRNPAPDYPPLAKRRGEQGRVELRVLVSADGDARTVEIRSSSGSATLDRTALETVRRWRFVPARLGTTPVEAWVIVPVSFSLTR